MTVLANEIWVEKYRPTRIDDLILKEKATLKKFLGQPRSMPSFIFTSSSPGTGKTSTAKVIIKELSCDSMMINSSDERGIDTVRDKVSFFVKSLSTDGSKRCVFMDEADGLTLPAQDSLRNLMETFSDNSFFIFSCNDVSKIQKPVVSRCTIMDFATPDKQEIKTKLEYICSQEKVAMASERLDTLIDMFYPDIRSMVKTLQEIKISGRELIVQDLTFIEFFNAIERKDFEYLRQKTYSGEFDYQGFNKWCFRFIGQNWKEWGLERTSKALKLLADTEKNWQLGATLDVLFFANIIGVMEVLENERG